VPSLRGIRGNPVHLRIPIGHFSEIPRRRGPSGSVVIQVRRSGDRIVAFSVSVGIPAQFDDEARSNALTGRRWQGIPTDGFRGSELPL
jgi:hypothetical protein